MLSWEAELSGLAGNMDVFVDALNDLFTGTTNPLLALALSMHLKVLVGVAAAGLIGALLWRFPGVADESSRSLSYVFTSRQEPAAHAEHVPFVFERLPVTVAQHRASRFLEVRPQVRVCVSVAELLSVLCPSYSSRIGSRRRFAAHAYQAITAFLQH